MGGGARGALGASTGTPAFGPLIPECFDRYNVSMSAHAPASQAEHGGAVPGSEMPGGGDDGRSARLDHEGLEGAVAALQLWRCASASVAIVAIDGYGASGKSTIADHLCAATGASLVRTDDFFLPTERQPRAGAGGKAGGAGEPALGEASRPLVSFYDLTRLRAEALELLSAGHEAVFNAFDWDTGAISGRLTRVEPADLVLVEGVCSSAPELSDLVDRAIFVDTPEPDRLRRLEGRIAPQDWDWDWLAAEKHYFSATRPMTSFDLVIRGSGT